MKVIAIILLVSVSTCQEKKHYEVKNNIIITAEGDTINIDSIIVKDLEDE